MRVFSIALAAVWLMWSALAGAEDLPYELIQPPVPTTVESPGQVELVELFWYSCPHCYHFDPVLKKWLETKPDYIRFRPMPAVYDGPRGLNLAKAFYTAEVLGVLDKIHDPLFHAYQVKKQRFQKPSEIRDLFMAQGVSKEDFDNTFGSFAVDMKLRQARTLTARYGIREVPTLVLNGKYRLETGKAGGYKGLLELVDKLAAQEHQAALASLEKGDATSSTDKVQAE